MRVVVRCVCIRNQDSCRGDQTDCTECFWQRKVVLFLCVFSLPSFCCLPSLLSCPPLSSPLMSIYVLQYISLLSPLSFCPISPFFTPLSPLSFPPYSANLYAIIPLQQSNLNVEQML